MTEQTTNGPVSVVPSIAVHEQDSMTGVAGTGGFTEQSGKTPEAIAVRKGLPRPVSSGKKKPAVQPTRPETRYAIRTHWKAAKESAEQMIEASSTGDAMALLSAVDDLDLELAKLWELRAERDINWRTILNHVQGMIRELFARKTVEQLNLQQCRHITEIVERYLGTATKTIDDLNEVVRLIEDAGFDPYAAVSADPVEGHVQ